MLVTTYEVYAPASIYHFLQKIVMNEFPGLASQVEKGQEALSFEPNDLLPPSMRRLCRLCP